MTIDQTRVNQHAATQQVQMILWLATWKRLVLTAAAFVIIPATVFHLAMLGSDGNAGMALFDWFAVMPLIFLVTRRLPDASMDDIVSRFERQSELTALRAARAEQARQAVHQDAA